MENLNHFIQKSNIKTIFEDIIGNGTRQVLTNNALSNAVPNSFYWSKNKDKLGNYFWRDLVLVGSLLVGVLTAPALLIINKAFKNGENRKEEHDGVYYPYDKESLEFLEKQDIKKYLKIVKLNKKKFEAQLELTKDDNEKTNKKNKHFVSIEEINNEYNEYVKIKVDNEERCTGYFGIYFNICCLGLGRILIAKVGENDEIIRVLAFEVENDTPNIGNVIVEIIDKLLNDKEINKIFGLKEGSYIRISNLETNKDIKDNIIRQMGFEKTKGLKKLNGDYYFLSKAKRDEAKKKLNKENNESNNNNSSNNNNTNN